MKSTLAAFALMLASATAWSCSKSSTAPTEEKPSTPAAPAAAAPAPATPAVKTYQVNLNPPLKVGQKISLACDTSTTMDMAIEVSAPQMPAPQKQNQNQKSSVHLEADAEVLAVNPNGSPKKLSLTFKNIQATQNDAPVTGLPQAGDTVVAEFTDQNAKTFTKNGQPLAPALPAFVAEVIPVTAQGQSDQDLFGPKEAMPVGGTWAASPAVIAELAKTGGTATGLDGVMKLDGIQGEGANQVATVSGKLKLTGVSLPLPAGVQATPGDCNIELSGTFPAAAKGALSESTTMTMTMSAEGDINGAHLRMGVNAKRTGTQTITMP
ncbi:MAG TPA: hypothetical protein VHC95_12900 [Opitutales bacterium]|nr:hypothetical protein [Opitutales bacterium]